MTTRQSHLVHLSLKRSAKDVYAFLSRPQNYATWGGIHPGMVQVGPHDWTVETTFGPRIVRFCEPNDFGILDHAVFRDGDEPVMLPMRVVPNAEGCELIFVFFRRDEMTDEQFASTIEWIDTDFFTLQSLLEV